jgi:hypothetical protein
MSIAVTSSVTKSDKVTLFTSKDDFDTWLAGITVPDALTDAKGVVTMGAAVTSPSGNSATNNQTAIIALLVSLRNAGVITT